MTKEDLSIVFMGTPEFAVGTLRALVESGFRVVAVVTQPDRPVGRHGSVLQPSAVKQYALSQGLPVLQPEKMRDPAFLEQLHSYQANLQVVVAFRMLPEEVWAMPRYGTFNVHASLLPQYRGAAPINWAIINGETQTGVTTFFLDHQIDTGRIILQRPFDIPDDADVEYVYDGLMSLGAAVCLETVARIIATDGHPETRSQEDAPSVPSSQCPPVSPAGATPPSAPTSTPSTQCPPVSPAGATVPLKPAPKLFKENTRIDWSRTAKQVYDFVRGLSPVPVAWTVMVDSQGHELPVKVYRTTKTGTPLPQPVPEGRLVTDRRHLYVCCSDTLLQVDELQLAGKKRMAADAFLNGVKDIDRWRIG